MPEQALIAPATRTDPSRHNAVARGPAELAVKSRGSEAVPALGHFLSRMIYTSSYALSFGVVFPVMLVVRVVPRNNAMVHGLIDGAHAARETIARRDAAPAAAHHAHTATARPAVAGHESSPDGQPAEETNHRPRASASKRKVSPRATPKRSPRKS